MSRAPTLESLPASWRLRAISLEQTGMAVAPQMLRECAEELEAALQDREAKRTSWFDHEHDAERASRKAVGDE